MDYACHSCKLFLDEDTISNLDDPACPFCGKQLVQIDTPPTTGESFEAWAARLPTV
jgi:DNA-directed RNA polymerase subunit RPC12/RpoP